MLRKGSHGIQAAADVLVAHGTEDDAQGTPFADNMPERVGQHRGPVRVVGHIQHDVRIGPHQVETAGDAGVGLHGSEAAAQDFLLQTETFGKKIQDGQCNAGVLDRVDAGQTDQQRIQLPSVQHKRADGSLKAHAAIERPAVILRKEERGAGGIGNAGKDRTQVRAHAPHNDGNTRLDDSPFLTRYLLVALPQMFCVVQAD